MFFIIRMQDEWYRPEHTCVVTADTPLGTYTSAYPKGAFLDSKKLLSNEEFGANCIDQSIMKRMDINICSMEVLQEFM